MNTSTFAPSAHEVDAGRAPHPAAALLELARRGGLAVWRGLEAYGRAKAQRELRDLHDRWETSDPHAGAAAAHGQGVPRRRRQAPRRLIVERCGRREEAVRRA